MDEIRQQAASQTKPGKVQAIAILTLIDGILSILIGLGWIVAVVVGTLGIGIICTPVLVYPIVMGILAIIYASKLIAEPPTVDKPAQYVAIMQIINIVFGGVLSLVSGILALVFYGDPEVKAYFARLQAQESRHSPHV